MSVSFAVRPEITEKTCDACDQTHPFTEQFWSGPYARVCLFCLQKNARPTAAPDERWPRYELLPGVSVTVAQLRLLTLIFTEGLTPDETAARLGLEVRTVEDGIRALRRPVCRALGLTEYAGSYAWLGRLGYLVGQLHQKGFDHAR